MTAARTLTPDADSQIAIEHPRQTGFPRVRACLRLDAEEGRRGCVLRSDRVRDKPPFMKLYPGDFFGSRAVRELSGPEQAAYLLALTIAWDEPDCCLPSDKEMLRRCLGYAKRGFDKYANVIYQNFDQLDDGRLRNCRQYKEFQGAMKTSNARSEAGRKGGLAKAGLKPGTSIPDARYQMPDARHQTPDAGGGAGHAGVVDETPDPVTRLTFELGIAATQAEQAWRTHRHTDADVEAWLGFLARVRTRGKFPDGSKIQSPKRLVASLATSHRRPEETDLWAELETADQPPKKRLYLRDEDELLRLVDGVEWLEENGVAVRPGKGKK